MLQHLRVSSLVKEICNRDLNEAETRHRVIDTILSDVLDWPKSAMRLEYSNSEGYADYILMKPSGHPAMVVEAKREGLYFELPGSLKGSRTTSYTSVRTLLTDRNLAGAIEQVRRYCLDIGCSFGAVTNGHEWIVFRVFESGVDWRSLRAYVISSIDSINGNFSAVYNALSYRCVCFDGSLNSLLSRCPLENRETYKPSHEIPAYARAIQPNRYVPHLRPIAEQYFGVIDPSRSDFMNACYVTDSEYDSAFSSARSMLADALTPYLEEYGVRQTANDAGGGSFGNRLERSLVERRLKDVVVLFGGKGIGKSTFLRRLLYVNPPQILKKNAVTVIIDLLDVPEEKAQVTDYIWRSLVRQLDGDGVLSGERDSLIALFVDRFDVAARQDLFGMPVGSVEYNKTLNSLISSWKTDLQYVATRLAKRLASQHKGAVVVIDNTDQYGRKLQEYCFTTAHEIAGLLNCLSIVSMREERFYASSIHGVLDAYQNSGFHLSAPPPKNVFIKRLRFVKSILAQEGRDGLLKGVDRSIVLKIKDLLSSFENEFLDKDSHLSGFLTACAHGNIRLALELFRGMLVSRYTNVDEITSRDSWTWQIHQVLKPVMIPNRFFYDESQSHVPNIFQLRSKKKSSHFSALRILRPLKELSAIQGTAFYSLATLQTEFSGRFQMDEDFRFNLDVLLKYGLVESNNRIDEFSDEIDGVRITTYGAYLFDDLLIAFTYIELVSTDTAMFEAAVSSELARLSVEEYRLWEESWNDQKKRVERVETRLKKADAFVEYLEREECREAEEYGLTPEERFTQRIRFSLDDESEEVMRSAMRQRFYQTQR